MKKITIQILNEDKNIEKTINFLYKNFNCNIIIDNSIGSNARNKLTLESKTDWQMYLFSGELIHEHEHILNFLENPIGNSAKIQVLNGSIITKQTRIWNKSVRFINPVYETIDDNSTFIESIILSYNIPLNESLLNKWRQDQPLSPDPYYYLACLALSQKRYDKFLNLSDNFLFKIKNITLSKIMIKYYQAIVYFSVYKEYNKAINCILECISNNPLMSEFWCVAGDLYQDIKEHKKAISLYENAIYLGQKRLRSDDYPMELSKYKDYPMKMIERCEVSLKETRKFKLINPS